MIEITVKLADNERKYSKKFLTYNSLDLNPDSQYLKDLIAECSEDFKGNPEDIIILTKMIIQ